VAAADSAGAAVEAGHRSSFTEGNEANEEARGCGSQRQNVFWLPPIQAEFFCFVGFVAFCESDFGFRVEAGAGGAAVAGDGGVDPDFSQQHSDGEERGRKQPGIGVRSPLDR
jgi:hypothetical protein